MGMNSHGMVYYKVGFYMQTNKMADTAGQFNMALSGIKKKRSLCGSTELFKRKFC